jgi:hypothetical protein
LDDVLVPTVGISNMKCIEMDPRSVDLLSEKQPELKVSHQHVLQVDYLWFSKQPFNNDNDSGGPLSIIDNVLSYYLPDFVCTGQFIILTS